MMPAVTDPPRPNGLPTAITHWPIRIFSESPNFTAFKGLSVFTRKTARSIFGSLPTTSALSLEPSVKITSMSVASPTTWLLVTTTPEESITKPEPKEFDLRMRGCGGTSPCPCRLRLKKSSKRSSNGVFCESPGALKLRTCSVVVAEMFTTASTTWSATSEISPGPRAALTGVGAAVTSATARQSPTGLNKAALGRF
jgi:hypothetical protein